MWAEGERGGRRGEKGGQVGGVRMRMQSGEKEWAMVVLRRRGPPGATLLPSTALFGAGDGGVHRRTARGRGGEVGDTLRLGEGDAAVEARVGAVIDSQLVGTGVRVRDAAIDAVVPAAQATDRNRVG